MGSALNRKRVDMLLRQYFGRSPYWSTLDAVIAPVLELLAVSDRTAVIAEASTRLLLNLLGWHGSVARSSACPAHVGRVPDQVRLKESVSCVYQETCFVAVSHSSCSTSSLSMSS